MGLIATILGPSAMAQGDPGDPRDPGPRFAPRKILVRLWTDDDEPSPFSVGGVGEDWRHAPEPGSVRDIADSLIAQRTAGRVLHRFWFVPGLEVWEVPQGEELARKAAAAEIPWVRYAVVSHAGTLAAPPPVNDPAYEYQWGLDRICMSQAWDIIKDCSNFPIAIVDSGVDYLNDQLGPNILVNTGEPVPADGLDNDNNGYIDDHWGVNVTTLSMDCAKAIACDQTCEGDPTPGANGDPHGSRVAGVAAARTDDCRSTAGVGLDARIIPIRIASTNNPICGYNAVFSSTEIALAFEYAIERGARIVNCSWGFSDIPFAEDQALHDTFEALETYNIVAVVAASNECADIDAIPHPPGVAVYPAIYTFSNMIVVGASNPVDDPWLIDPPPSGVCGSNFGDTSVDIFAPGESIRSFSSGDDTPVACTAIANGFFEAGTSFAAPHVAGVAALVWARYPTWSAADVVNRIRSTARAVPALSRLCVSGGVLDASAAVGGASCNPWPLRLGE